MGGPAVGSKMLAELRKILSKWFGPTQQKAAALILFLLLLRRVRRTLRRILFGKYAHVSKQWQDGVVADERPLISFSGAGLLWGYYVGVVCYLQQHFVLDNVRFAGISMGSMPSSAAALGLSGLQMFKIGLTWQELISRRRLKWFLLTPSDFINSGSAICEQFGVDDERVRGLSPGKCMVGTTDVSVFPPQHIILSEPNGIRQAMYMATISMRVVPFFRAPAWFKRMCLIDGGATALFTIPDDGKVDYSLP